MAGNILGTIRPAARIGVSGFCDSAGVVLRKDQAGSDLKLAEV